MLKTQNCGELRPEHVGQEVTLAGWVHRRRDQGGLIFIDLRDRWGITQIRIDQENQPQAHEVASGLRSEYVIQVRGKVALRPEGTVNPQLADRRSRSHPRPRSMLLNTAKTPPFLINRDEFVEEEARMRYRYLYLRRPAVQDKLILRHRIVKFIRDYLDARGFHRNRDADPVQDDARRRARLPRAQPPDAGDSSTRCRRVRSS